MQNVTGAFGDKTSVNMTIIPVSVVEHNIQISLIPVGWWWNISPAPICERCHVLFVCNVHLRTEAEILSFWQIWCHWLHRKSPFLTTYDTTNDKILQKWRQLSFSGPFGDIWRIWPQIMYDYLLIFFIIIYVHNSLLIVSLYHLIIVQYAKTSVKHLNEPHLSHKKYIDEGYE